MYLLVLERSGHITKDEYIHTKDRSKQVTKLGIGMINQ